MSEDPIQDPQTGGGGESPPTLGDQVAVSSEAVQTPGNEGKDVDEEEVRFVTKEILQGSQNALRRFLSEDIKKSQSSLKDELSGILNKAIEDRLSTLDPDPKSKGAKGSKDDAVDSETAKILREHQDAIQEITKLRAELGESQTKEKDFRFRTRVMDSLQKLGCKKPEFAFRIISDHLKLDEENPDRVFAIVKGEWGDEELDLDDYLVRHVRDEMIPELFSGINKPGSPAGGDTGGSHYLFTAEQINDPNFYRENIDKIRSALEKGLVKGISKPA